MSNFKKNYPFESTLAASHMLQARSSLVCIISSKAGCANGCESLKWIIFLFRTSSLQKFALKKVHKWKIRAEAQTNHSMNPHACREREFSKRTASSDCSLYRRNKKLSSVDKTDAKKQLNKANFQRYQNHLQLEVALN